jgi:hypothetical protein
MSNRRKFIAGLGALATGSAAAIGTGAFTSVTAERTVNVKVAGDASAYLGLEQVNQSPNSDYVLRNNGEVSFDFSGADGDSSGGGSVDGDGFNPDATTRIDDVLRVTNQGTQAANFWVNIENLGAGSDFLTIEASGYPTFSSSMGSKTGASTQLAYDGGNGSSVKPYNLTPGEDIYLHLVVDATAQGGQSPNSFSGSVTFVAASDDSQPPL